MFQLLRRYTVTSSASLSYVATFLSFPFTLDVLHSKSSSWLSSSQRRDRYIARIEPIVSFEQNAISTKRTRFRLVAFPSPYEKSGLFGERLNPVTQKERDNDRGEKRRAYILFAQAIDSGTVERLSGMTNGRACHSRTKVLVFPRYSSAVIYFDSVLLLFII